MPLKREKTGRTLLFCGLFLFQAPELLFDDGNDVVFDRDEIGLDVLFRYFPDLGNFPVGLFLPGNGFVVVEDLAVEGLELNALLRVVGHDTDKLT